MPEHQLSDQERAMTHRDILCQIADLMKLNWVYRQEEDHPVIDMSTTKEK